ncbi:hypothetical protein MNBD_UNCLBAC01-1164 [hydrothermal vent metagenome]|uniref:ABC3 transporter permease C-terminal domain-containing protein n=1 Tax=hydrothermal vent metagenome TaxID=652676 RepID=A0A3B1E1B7_9ZZZZ
MIFWLALLEFMNKKLSFITGIGMVAVVVALCTTTELISRARESATRNEINYIGPSLRLIPSGKTVKDLAAFELGSDYFSRDYFKKINKRLARYLRAVDGRLLLKISLNGTLLPVVGINPRDVISPFDVLHRLSKNDVTLGNELSLKLGKTKGDKIIIKNKEFNIVAVLAQTASMEDLALFMPLNSLQSLFGLLNKVNEIRIFPKEGQAKMIMRKLKSKDKKVKVIYTPRGDVAEHKITGSLSEHRRVLYFIMAVIIALCLFIWSYLDLSERNIEMATVIAIGGTSMTVLEILAFKTAVVGFFGSIIGYMAGAMITLVQNYHAAVPVIWSWSLFFSISFGTVFFSIFGALPVSYSLAFQNHVKLLQE